MKWIRYIRITLELALLALVVWLIVGGHDAVVNHAWVTLDLSLASLGAVIVWLAITLLLGRVYCSSMCPIGTLQDAVAWLSKRIRYRGRGRYHHVAGDWRLRYLTLLLIVVSLTGDGGHIAALTDPVALTRNVACQLPLWLHGAIAVSLGLVLGIVALLAVMWMAWRDGRSFCNTVCPVGTVLGTASAMSLMHLEIDPDLCVGCGLCERECKAKCVDHLAHTIDTSRCVMCLNCIAECPNDAITYRPDRKRLSTPLMMRTPQLRTSKNTTTI